MALFSSQASLRPNVREVRLNWNTEFFELGVLSSSLGEMLSSQFHLRFRSMYCLLHYMPDLGGRFCKIVTQLGTFAGSSGDSPANVISTDSVR